MDGFFCILCNLTFYLHVLHFVFIYFLPIFKQNTNKYLSFVRTMGVLCNTS